MGAERYFQHITLVMSGRIGEALTLIDDQIPSSLTLIHDQIPSSSVR